MYIYICIYIYIYVYILGNLEQMGSRTINSHVEIAMFSGCGIHFRVSINRIENIVRCCQFCWLFQEKPGSSPQPFVQGPSVLFGFVQPMTHPLSFHDPASLDTPGCPAKQAQTPCKTLMPGVVWALVSDHVPSIRVSCQNHAWDARWGLADIMYPPVIKRGSWKSTRN